MRNNPRGPLAVRWSAPGLLVSLLTACPASTPPAEPAPPVAEVPSTEKPAPAPSAELEQPPDKLPLIAEGRVGELALEAPLPGALLLADLDKRYKTTLYADAQPLEGFVFDAPPLFATVRGGPYHDFGMATPGDPIPETMPADAVALAKAGKLTVTMLVITDARLRTAEGVGVGSTYAEVAKAYDKLDTYTFPGLWEEPSCIARPHTDSTIHFFFAKCAPAQAADKKVKPDEKVIRAVVVNTKGD